MGDNPDSMIARGAAVVVERPWIVALLYVAAVVAVVVSAGLHKGE